MTNDSFTLGLLLQDTPIRITPTLKLYQPTIRDVVSMGEAHYNALMKIWTLSRDKLVPEETEYTKTLDDYEIWKEYIISIPQMLAVLEESVLVFFHKKIEFFPISRTIYIGEARDGSLLDLGLFLLIKSLFSKLDYTKSSDKDQQYQETKNMSEREKRLIALMKEREAKLNKLKNGEQNLDDMFGKQIVSLVAIGKYTYQEVYDMTMLQFTNALHKYADIERYEIHAMLSPYMSSKDGKNQENKHWLAN